MSNEKRMTTNCGPLSRSAVRNAVEAKLDKKDIPYLSVNSLKETVQIVLPGKIKSQQAQEIYDIFEDPSLLGFSKKDEATRVPAKEGEPKNKATVAKDQFGVVLRTILTLDKTYSCVCHANIPEDIDEDEAESQDPVIDPVEPSADPVVSNEPIEPIPSDAPEGETTAPITE